MRKYINKLSYKTGGWRIYNSLINNDRFKDKQIWFSVIDSFVQMTFGKEIRVILNI